MKMRVLIIACFLILIEISSATEDFTYCQLASLSPEKCRKSRYIRETCTELCKFESAGGCRGLPCHSGSCSRADEYKCPNNRRCIYDFQRFDGIDDCDDRSDETTALSSQELDKRTTEDATFCQFIGLTEGRCSSNRYMREKCPEWCTFEGAYGCIGLPCHSGTCSRTDESNCSNGKCIYTFQKNDGVEDCGDGSDEGLSCRQDYHRVGSQCFQIVLVQRNWYEARKYCQELGADLAQPKDLRALAAYIEDNGHGTWYGGGAFYQFWLGGSDSSQPGVLGRPGVPGDLGRRSRVGVWKWNNGSPINGGWDKGQPNEHMWRAGIVADGSPEKCLSFFWPNQHNSLHDWDCNAYYQRFICERS